MTVPQYRQELTEWTARLDNLRAHPDQAAKMERQVPPAWLVQQGDRTLHVSSGWLQAGMARIVDDRIHAVRPPAGATAPVGRCGRGFDCRQQMPALLGAPPSCRDRNADILRLRDAVTAHLELLDGAGVRPDTAAARVHMQRILSGREFRGVHPPGVVEDARNRIWAWVTDHLRRALRRATAHPVLLQWAIWGVILLAMATALRFVWIFAQGRRQPGHPPELPTDRPSSTPWQSWVERARAAAVTGSFRDAVHGAYWAAISWLETQGAWLPDRARTPREYLRLLRPQSPQRRILLALTRRFEPVWYGGHDATANDFDAMLRELDELGCR